LLNLVEAFSVIEDAHLVMIGGGELEEDLKRIVEKKNLTKRVTFLGYIPTDELIRTSAQADLGIVLFEPTSINYSYALPNKFFEYIMAGLPVLASKIKTFENYVENYQVGLTVDPFNIAMISQSLVDMLSDKEKMTQWRLNSLKASKELNWEMEAKKMNQIYENI
jgi:glycosyltransferase involved in cell wall biosynthesis